MARGAASRAERLPEGSEDDAAEYDVHEHQGAGVGGDDVGLDACVETSQATEEDSVHGEVDEVERYGGCEGSGHRECSGGDERQAEEADLEEICNRVGAVGGRG